MFDAKYSKYLAYTSRYFGSLLILTKILCIWPSGVPLIARAQVCLKLERSISVIDSISHIVASLKRDSKVTSRISSHN
jgi:hypothetical protein